MPDAELLTADPVAESEDAASAVSEESASPQTGSDDDISPESVAQMNALIRGQIAAAVQAGSASKPETDDAGEAGDAQGGESAPSGDVKPSDQPGQQPGRRGAAAEIERLSGEVARLTKLLDEANPPPPDASEESRKAAWEREQRYRKLAAKPWKDADWSQDDVEFFTTEQERRALFPEIFAQHQVALDQDLQEHERAYQAKHEAFQAYVLDGMEAIKGLPGVDFDAIKAAPDFRAREQLIYRAGQASKEAENRQLRETIADLRRDALDGTRAPIAGGRSSPGRAVDTDTYMNTLLRGGRA